mmetsp:Transcript_149718/g.264755  ORF Transcript_149718/g.264755 Transcript_149718/m.264755 type:complete len:212 (-) Transcript_149718:1464-2099(-)
MMTNKSSTCLKQTLMAIISERLCPRAFRIMMKSYLFSSLSPMIAIISSGNASEESSVMPGSSFESLRRFSASVGTVGIRRWLLTSFRTRSLPAFPDSERTHTPSFKPPAKPSSAFTVTSESIPKCFVIILLASGWLGSKDVLPSNLSSAIGKPDPAASDAAAGSSLAGSAASCLLPGKLAAPAAPSAATSAATSVLADFSLALACAALSPH